MPVTFYMAIQELIQLILISGQTHQNHQRWHRAQLVELLFDLGSILTLGAFCLEFACCLCDSVGFL